MEKDIIYICQKCNEKLTEHDILTGDIQLSKKRINSIDSKKGNKGTSIRIGKHKGCGGVVIASSKKRILNIK